jgi:hypothetical protein
MNHEHGGIVAKRRRTKEWNNYTERNRVVMRRNKVSVDTICQCDFMMIEATGAK